MKVVNSMYYNGENVLEEIKKAVGPLTSKDMLNDTLIRTSRFGEVEAAKYLVSQGADILTGNNLPVREASKHNCPEMVRFLVEQGADIRDSDGPESRNAIQWAFFYGYKKLLAYLIEDRGVSVNAYGNYVIRCTITHRRVDVVKLLIQRFGADVDEEALEIAVENNYPELVEYLGGHINRS